MRKAAGVRSGNHARAVAGSVSGAEVRQDPLPWALPAVEETPRLLEGERLPLP